MTYNHHPTLQLLPAPGHFLVRILDASRVPVAAIDVFNGALEVPDIDAAVLRMRAGPSWLVWVRCLNNIAAAPRTSAARTAAATWLSAALFYLSVGPFRAPFPATPDIRVDASCSVEHICLVAACAGAARTLKPHLLDDFKMPQSDERLCRVLVGLARDFYGLRGSITAADELMSKLQAAYPDTPAVVAGAGGAGSRGDDLGVFAGREVRPVLGAVQFLASATLEATKTAVAQDARTPPWACKGADDLPLHPRDPGEAECLYRARFVLGQSPSVWRGIDDALRRGSVRAPPSPPPRAAGLGVCGGAGGGGDLEGRSGDGASECAWDEEPAATRGLEVCDGEPLRALAWLYGWPDVAGQLRRLVSLALGGPAGAGTAM